MMIHRQHLGAARRSVAREAELPEASSLLLGRQLLASGSTPSAHLARKELARRVRCAVARLAERDREILLLRSFEGLSNQEAAQVLGVQPDTASQRYGRALLRLRRELEGEGLEEERS